MTAKKKFDFVTTYKQTSGMENLVLYIRKVSANFMRGVPSNDTSFQGQPLKTLLDR
jgi:hypothetical protein